MGQCILPLKEFPLPECTPLKNDSYISGREKEVSGGWCQQWMIQASEEPASCLECGIWVALGCFAKEQFLFLSGRIGLELQKKELLPWPEFISIRKFPGFWQEKRNRGWEARFMAVGKEKVHVYNIPGLSEWVYSLEIFLETSYKNGLQASSGFWFLDHPNITFPAFPLVYRHVMNCLTIIRVSFFQNE